MAPAFDGPLQTGATTSAEATAARRSPTRRRMNRAPTEHTDRQRGAVYLARALGEVVRAFKARTTVAINPNVGEVGLPVWQRSYHDHVIRGDEDQDRVRQYIAENPEKQALDCENPDRVS